MEEREIKELTETTYGLMVVLKDTIWKFEGICKDNQVKYGKTGHTRTNRNNLWVDSNVKGYYLEI